MARTSPSYVGLEPASEKASKAARGASRKRDTKPERLLRSLLWSRGLRFRKDYAALPGRPDIVFTRAKVAVFVDGDFWHGKDWAARKEKLASGNNPDYWIAKIERNMQRDRGNDEALRDSGWVVLRIWESDLIADPGGSVRTVVGALSSGPR